MLESATALGRCRWLAILLLAAPAPLAACDSGGEQAGSTAATGSGVESMPVVPAPTGLRATVRGIHVVLRWSPPSEGPAIEGYGVYRNGSLLRGVSGAETTFTDENVKPGRTYTYEVRARASGSVSEGVSTDVKVRVPPLSAARVVGDFAVTTRVESKSGYSTFERPTFGWHFTPKCRSGACDVAWRDLSQDRVHARLERRRGRYQGHYTGLFLSECSGTRTTSSVDVALRVEKARPIAGEWRATKLTGTVEISEAAQLGCTSSSAELTAIAKLTSAG